MKDGKQILNAVQSSKFTPTATKSLPSQNPQFPTTSSALLDSKTNHEVDRRFGDDGREEKGNGRRLDPSIQQTPACLPDSARRPLFPSAADGPPRR